ncbi:MAG: class II fructose-bisphosphate aldolase [Patescibacteria group bacterium]
MVTLIECIRDAESKKQAVGHFNISNLEGLWGVFNAAKSLNLPLVIGVSEGERDFIGIPQVVALIQSLREEFNYPVFLNADHTYSVERVKEAIDAGFDSVIFDGAKLSLEENIAKTKECVEYARSKNPNVLVEAELGYIGMSSKLLDAVPEGVSFENLTTPEDASRFVKETGVDLFAPAVGNIHGMLKNAPEPKLDIPRIKQIREAAGVPLVLHGGSGTSDEDFRGAIENGMALIHVSTELRVAFHKGLIQVLQEKPDEIAPYKYLDTPRKAIEEVATKRLKLFSGLGSQ